MDKENQNTFTSHIIGNTTLCIQCAEVLLEQNHKIYGITTSDPEVKQWAEDHSISCYFSHSIADNNIDELYQFLSNPGFDYLFSIVNPLVLPEVIIGLPIKLAVNYHDGPLPKYGGRHATSWAIKNQEKIHGITWHIIENKVDAGDILKQKAIKIAENETALTLNAKCYENAIGAFRELIYELAVGQVKRIQQDLNERSFFLFNQQPAAACTLNWSHRSDQLNSLVRSLDFGAYPNPLGLPKLYLGGEFIVVTKLKQLESKSEQTPGTILAIDDTSIHVSTGTNDVTIAGFHLIDGKSRRIAEIIDQFDLHPGVQLPVLDSKTENSITEYSKTFRRHEPYWVNVLSTLEPIQIPYFKEDKLVDENVQYKSSLLTIPEMSDTENQNNVTHPLSVGFILSSFTAYLARLTGTYTFNLGYRNSTLENKKNDGCLEKLFSSYIPFRVELDKNLNIKETINRIITQAKITKKSKTFARDTILRFPEIQIRNEIQDVLPVLFEVINGEFELETYQPTYQADLILRIQKPQTINDNPVVHWVYNTKRIRSENISRMQRQFNSFFCSLVRNPKQQIGSLPILSEEECHLILEEWNDTEVAYPGRPCLHELFEDQVKATPERIAVIYLEQELSYEELNERSNQFANFLQDKGVGPETLVGICMERSLEIIVGLLGILKAGGAYVPIDPKLPKKRIRYIIENTGITRLITQTHLVDELPQQELDIICLDPNWNSLSNQNIHNLGKVINPENLAYVLFTSGSTGQPKGVSVQHRSITNVLSWFNSLFQNASVFQTPTLSNINFDASMKQIWAPLLCGGTVLMIPDDINADPHEICDLISSQQRVVISCVPSLWNAIVDEFQIGQVNMPQGTITHLFLGGETFKQDLIDKTREVFPKVEIWNLYGPTETTVNSTGGKLEVNSEITIGQPAANTQIYILDRNHQPVPIGVPGQVFIGGVGLARGYWNSPSLTAEMFIPNPFKGEIGSRLYASGDLAKWKLDGRIKFLGRIDHQVKLRGFRIELGEIEAVISEFSGVKEVIVITHGNDHDSRKLVAYIVPEKQDSFNIEELHNHLQNHLPEYMVPSSFMKIDSLPLTSNRKINRNALPEPDNLRVDLGETFIGPRTPTEEIIVSIWQKILDRSQIGVNDNFFELGGHSLSATRVINQIRKAFDVEIHLKTLFEFPTVSGLAALIWDLTGWFSFPIIPVPRDKLLPLSFAQQRFWFLDQLEPGNPTYNISQAFCLTGLLNKTALEQSLYEIIDRHESLRTIFKEVAGEPYQVILENPDVTLEVIDLSEYSDAVRELEIEKLIIAERGQHFDLSEGPLFKFKLLCIHQEKHILIITIHHIVSDGWSEGLLNKELSILYNSHIIDVPPDLPEVTIQYADFSIWQLEWMQGQIIQDQLSYWQNKLANYTTLEIPSDYPRPATQTNNGETQELTLSKAFTESIKLLCRAEKATSFMILLTTLKILLHRYTGQTDILVGIPIAGRNHTETENLIGLFLNSLVLRSDLSGDPSFRDLFKQVRRASIEAYENQDIPFEKIIEELNPPRDLSRTPIYQVFFNMVNVSLDKPDFQNLIVEPYQIESKFAKFDLTVYVMEKDEQFHFSFSYNTDIFSWKRISEILVHYENLLDQVVNHPDERISEYELISPHSKTLLPDPTMPLSKVWLGTVFDQVSKHAKGNPNRVAILDKNREWSYEYLDHYINWIASWLIASGIQSGEIVAVYADRTSELIAALLGIHKAGCAFLILDPSYPPSRLLDYIDLSEPSGFIQIGEDRDLPLELNDSLDKINIKLKLTLPLIINPGELDTFAKQNAQPEFPLVGPDDLAYIAFTSGSTGSPKGILGEHASLTHFLDWHHQSFGLKESDRFSMLSGLAYDPFLRDIFTPLWVGAILCIPSSEDISPGQLTKWLHEKEITIIHLTPAMAQLLQGDSNNNQNLLMRYLFFGGDSLYKSQLNEVKEIAPLASFVNFYGATETPQAMGYYVVPENNSIESDVIPLGNGIDNVQLLVLNDYQKLAGIGELGEIYIRTPYLAKGYLGNGDLTRERFIINPYTQISDDRLYKTGDYGRYLLDGKVQYVGRLDRQVKIRGFRVELGEIENVLEQHSAVKQVVVITQEEKLGEKRLVAYIIPADNSAPSQSTLRKYLLSRLPDYMIPAVFIFLDVFPLTPNGKIDSRALPVPDHFRPELDEAYVAPSTPTEETIANIIQEILFINQVGVYDNFFDLGGHSLLAVKVISRLRDSFQIELPLRQFFEAKTVADIAKHIDMLPILRELQDQENTHDVVGDDWEEITF